MANVIKRGNSFRIRVSLGFDGNGKRIYKSKTYNPPKNLTPKQAQKEAEKQAVIFEEQCKTGQILDNNTRFAEFSEIWFHDYAEKQLKATTVARYKELLIRINAAFGNMKLSAIQPHHLLAFYDNLEESGVRKDVRYAPLPEFTQMFAAAKIGKEKFAAQADVGISTLRSALKGGNVYKASAEKISTALGKSLNELFEQNIDEGLSDKTILHHHRLLSVILNTAVQWQVLFSNPCQRVKPPRVKRKEARYLDEFQAADLLKAVQNEPYQYNVIVQLLLYTGMRRGELCGLEWQDVDFNTNCLHIQRNSLYIADKGIFEDEPKNETSKRVIKLSGSAVQLLREYKLWQDKQIVELGTAWENSNRLFTTWNGKPIRPDSITSWFHEFILKTGLPNCSIHSLRHTNATLLIARGTPIKTVSKRLGHANATTTSNIYLHAIQSADEAAAEILDDIFAPTNQQIKKIKGAE